MLKLVQLFTNDEFGKKLRTACSKIDSSIILNQTDANLYFSGVNGIRRDLVVLIDKSTISQFYAELHQLSVSNFMVYVYADEDEIIGNKKVENMADCYLPFNFSNINLYTTLNISRKALVGHSVTIFPRKLIHSSVSEIERLINNVSHRVFWKNRNGQYIGCNSKFANDFDLDNIKDIIGKTDDQLFDAHNAREFSAYDTQILKTADSVDEYEKEIEFKTGVKKWLRFKKYPHMKEGMVIGIIGVYESINTESHHQSEVYSDEKLLQVLMDNIPDTIYFKDQDSRFVKVNNAQAKLIGIENAEEAIGKTDFDYFDHKTSKEAFAIEQQIIFEGEQINKLEYLGTNDGKFRWMSSTKVPIKDEKGNIIGTAGITRDVHELISTRKKLEDQHDVLQLLIDHIPSPIFFKDNNSVFTMVNKALAHLHGKDSIDDILGKTDFDFYPLEEANLYFSEEKKIIDSGVSLLNKIENYNNGDVSKWLSITKIPVIDSNGDCTGIVGIAHDITEQILIKHRLEQAKQKAEAASVAKSNFLSNMSHEIRTPMNGIIGMADVLSLTELTDDQEKIVNIIMRSGNNLLNIINDILDLSKIEAGKLELEQNSINLKDLVDEVRELMEFSASESNITLYSKIDNNLPEYVLGDALRLKQVLLNLVSNAIKFTNKGSVNIEMKVIGHSDSKHCVQFKVIDTGIGMKQEQLENIFESFTQADSSTTRKYGGTGLGLSISHRLIEMMGGKLNVESEHGKGSTFSFEIFFDKVTVDEHNYF